MIIGVCGYVSSGSSAVSDYLKEFDSLNVLDDVELQMIYGPDGLEDLDYQLNTHCSKHLSSVVAIERFRKMMYLLYINQIKNESKRKELINLTEDYIHSITDVTWDGYGLSDYVLFSGENYKNRKTVLFRYRLGRKISHTIHNKFHKRWAKYPIHKLEFSILPDDFDVVTRNFVNQYLIFAGADVSKPIVIDQPFCGNNPYKSFKYFENPYAIIVDRDPRDMYIFAKKFLTSKGVYLIPAGNVIDYVKYYKKMRIHAKNDSDKILRIQFEDLVYNYEDTTTKINKFLGLNPVDRKRKIFDPSISIANTQVFKKIPGFEDDIKYIEEELSEFLFPFELYKDADTSGKMFYGKSPLNKS